MILTGRDIQWYIAAGKLGIDPVAPEQFQQNGIDLVLQDLDDGNSMLTRTAASRPVYFQRLEFYLGSTRETLTMPDDLMAFVELRSTWARRGLFIPPTVVDAGFQGNLTLEVLSTRGGLRVPYGERFAHLIFAKLTGPAEPYRGKYQGQQGVTSAKPD